MPTISIWDLFFVKNAFYDFHYFKYAITLALKKSFFFVQILYHFAQNKICLMTLPLKFLLFLWKNDVLSFKENDITSLIVEGGWSSDDNNLSFIERPHANLGTTFYYEDSPEILKWAFFYYIKIISSFAGSSKNIPFFFQIMDCCCRSSTSCCRHLKCCCRRSMSRWVVVVASLPTLVDPSPPSAEVF